jgi:aspartyl/asparaginyl beta-hydroxylase (cupin superfamily)
LIVGGERHDFKTGEVTLFDYTLPHEVKNEGTEERIVLLVVIDPKRARPYLATPEDRALTL